MPSRLNIVHLHAHDAGRMAQPYGYNVETPNIQRFAEQGVLFRQAFCAAPTCSPSRAAMMTGRYPHCCGMYGLATPTYGFKLDNAGHHLANHLADQGYLTALAGVQHEARLPLMDPAALGYQRMLSQETDGGYKHTRTLSAAMGFLSETHDRPFFLSVGFGEPHRDNGNRGRRHGYDADMPFVEDMDGRYTRPPAPIPDTPITRQDWASFQDGVKRYDDKVGAVLDAIDRAGLHDRTLVIVTADHGIAWPHGKDNLTDMGLGVMLMMRGPKGSGFEGGRVIDALVSHMDVYPTLCEVNGLVGPDWLQGVSLLPLITGEAESVRDHVFGEQGYHCLQRDPQRSIRTQRYRYTRRLDGPYIRIVDPGPTNNWMHQLGYREWPAGTELLYDTYFDPCECNNLADDPAHADIKRDLSDRLDAWIAETNDPFATGNIPEPTVAAPAR